VVAAKAKRDRLDAGGLQALRTLLRLELDPPSRTPLPTRGVGDRRTLVKGAWNVEPRSAAAPGPEGGQAVAGVGQFQVGDDGPGGMHAMEMRFR
jgi:hypothetical protein